MCTEKALRYKGTSTEIPVESFGRVTLALIAVRNLYRKFTERYLPKPTIDISTFFREIEYLKAGSCMVRGKSLRRASAKRIRCLCTSCCKALKVPLGYP